MAKTKKVSDDQIVMSLQANMGMVSKVAVALDMSSAGVYKRLKASKALQDAKYEIEQEFLDFTESKLLEKIKEGNMTGIIWYLKCKGKDRGWVERKELVGGDGEPLLGSGVVILPPVKAIGAGFDKDGKTPKKSKDKK